MSEFQKRMYVARQKSRECGQNCLQAQRMLNEFETKYRHWQEIAVALGELVEFRERRWPSIQYPHPHRFFVASYDVYPASHPGPLVEVIGCRLFLDPTLANDSKEAEAWCAAHGIATASCDTARQMPCDCGDPATLIAKYEDGDGDLGNGRWALDIERLCLKCGRLDRIAWRYRQIPSLARKATRQAADPVFGQFRSLAIKKADV